MKKILFLSGILCIILIISCTSSRRVHDAKANALFNEWLGHSKSELVNQWGQPDSVSADGKNGQILLYKEHLDYVSVMNGNYTGPQYSFKKEMFINSDSTIYYWKAWRRK
ncbi:MAG: hypothetical protein ABI594_05260 [Ginsengibacter sp.]